MTELASFPWTDLERQAWRPPEILSVSEWADARRVLDPLTANEGGPWRTSRTPYLREPMDSFADAGVEQVTMMTSAQVGKTEMIVNCLGYATDQDPGPCLVAMPREPDAERLLVRRIQPMYELSDELAQNITGWASDWKTKEIRLTRAIVYMAWAQSPASLAGVPCRYVFADEVDKWPQFSGREAAPLDLARKRQLTFPHTRRACVTSTPTTRGALVHQEWEDSDQRRYHVPCPHCGKYQVFRFEHVKPINDRGREAWDARDHKTIIDEHLAAYYCEYCAGRINDAQKLDAIDAGVWVADGGTVEDGVAVPPAGAPNRNRGYHLWAGYSPWVSWSQIAAEFLKALGEPAKMMDFVNSTLGEIWEEKIEDPNPDAIAAAASDYGRGEVPDGVQVLVAGVDVQKGDLFLTIWGFGVDERAWLILEARLRNFRALEDAIRADYGGKMVRKVCVDCRHRRAEVFELARQNPNVTAIRGVARNSAIPYTVSKADRHHSSGRVYKKGLQVWHLTVALFKDKLAHSIEVGPGPGKSHAFHTHREPTAEFCKQMVSEQKVRQYASDGTPKEKWVTKPGHRANHYWDTAVYAWAAAEIIGVPLNTSRRRIKRKTRGPMRSSRTMGSDL